MSNYMKGNWPPEKPEDVVRARNWFFAFLVLFFPLLWMAGKVLNFIFHALSLDHLNK